MYSGNFYATSGVILRVVEASERSIGVEVDVQGTENALSSSYVLAHVADEGEAGYTIEFIGEGGRVLETVKGTEATFSVNVHTSYVRAKVTYVRETDTGFERFYAWMQPVFTDGR